MDIQDTYAGRLQTLMFSFLDMGMPRGEAWEKACWVAASRTYKSAEGAERHKNIVPDDKWFNIPIFLQGMPNIAIESHTSLRTRWREWDHRAGELSRVIPGKTIYVILGWVEHADEEADLRRFSQAHVTRIRDNMRDEERKARYIDQFIMMCMYEEMNSLFRLIESIRPRA